MRSIALAALLTLSACSEAASVPYHLVPGTFEAGRQPDGNSVILDAPDGLIVVDTGRHAAHQEAVFAHADARGRPIAAIVNTHWHLDHSGGNAELRARFPKAEVVTSRAVEGALAGFLKDSRADALDYIASGHADPAQKAEIEGDIAAMDERVSLLPTLPVQASGPMTIAGRVLDIRLAQYAATEGDVWIVDEQAGLVIAGDLVVAAVPFLDTACVAGWRKALAEIAVTPFETLIPGHGSPMSRASFMEWRQAFENLVACAGSTAEETACAAGWKRDAAEFLTGMDPARIDGAIDYYMQTRLRAPPAERFRYCQAKG